MRRILFGIVFIFMALGSLLAQDDKFYVEATPGVSTVASGTPFSIEYALKYRGQSLNLQHSGIRITKPDLKDFEIVDEYQGSGMQFDFGASGITIQKYTVVLKAKTPGQKRIGPLSFTMNGKTYRSPELSIEVTKGEPSPQASAPKGPDASKLFARMSVSKRSVYEGEQVVVTHRIYSAVNLVSLGDVTFPGFEGFVTEEVPSSEVKLSSETVNGITYRVVELKQHVIFPRSAGTLRIDPLKVECIVQEIRERPARNANERFFYGPTVRYRDNVTYSISSPALSIDVKPLPEANRPASFDGMVGNYSIEASADKTDALTNDAITLSFKVSGKGNLGLAKPPVFNFPPDFEVYEPELSANYSASAAGVSGSKTWTWLLIPRREGDFAIPALQYSFFDPASGQYVSRDIAGMDFRIGKGQGNGSMVSVSGTAQEDVQFIGQDIRFIRTGLQLAALPAGEFTGSPWFYLLWLLPLLLLLAYFGIARKRGSAEAKLSRIQRRAAAKAGKSLRRSARLDDKAAYFEAVSQALYTYATERFGLDKAGMSVERLCAAILQASGDEEMAARFRDLLGECDYKRFAPPGMTEESAPLHERAEKAITELERRLR